MKQQQPPAGPDPIDVVSSSSLSLSEAVSSSATSSSSASAVPSAIYSGQKKSSLGRRMHSKKDIPSNNKNLTNDKDDEQACRHCGSVALRIDWAQGDRICTQCGVVDAEKLLETRAEWRDFDDAAGDGGPAVARCGMVPVDESKYLGGLQPTNLSKAPYGGHVVSSCVGGGASTALKLTMMRKRLQTTNRKLDALMGQRHARALENARISRAIRKRKLAQANNINMNPNETDQSDLDSIMTTDDDVRPEFESLLIQEEEDAHRMQATLNADKWSLRRAILLHGQHESFDGTDEDATQSERDDLQQRLDSKLRKASADLYVAYQMLVDSSRRLQLPDRVTHEATNMLCRYVAQRDGFHVKGVSSRLAVKKNNLSVVQRKRAADSLREHNKEKQMGSLCAALLLLTSRKLGWPRPLTEVCGSVQQIPSTRAANNPISQSPYSNSNNDASFIKAKHCSRAMTEIKTAFPDYARSIAVSGTATMQHSLSTSVLDDPASTINFVDHAVRKLQLPPVAEASVRALVWHCRQEPSTVGQDTAATMNSNGTKLSTLCASLAYFVCLSGSVMQRLASQAQTREQDTHSQQRKTAMIPLGTARSKIEARRKCNNMGPPPNKKPKVATSVLKSSSDKQSPSPASKSISSNDVVTAKVDGGNNEGEVFDVFSHGIGAELLDQKQEYEMRRVWDTWAEQTTWLRSLSDVEQSSGVSSSTILAHYKSNIYPRRQALLECLRDAVQDGTAVNVVESTSSSPDAAAPNPAVLLAPTNVLTETPLASVLLSHVVAASPLLTSSGKLQGIKG